MKKTIFVLALLLAAVSTLSGCVTDKPNDKPETLQTETPQTADTAETLAPEYVCELPELNFGSKEFVILVQDDPCFRHLYDVNAEEDSADAVQSAVYARNDYVEQTLGVKITDVKDAKAAMLIENAVKSGDNTYNAVWLKVDEFFNQAINGSFYDYSEVPYVDTAKAYWDQGVVRDFTYGGKLYGLMGDISTSVSIFTHLLGVNKTFASRLDIDMSQLYQTVLAGKWTLDAMNTLIKESNCYRDENGNSMRDGEDSYGFAVTPAVIEAMLASCGEYWVTKDKNDAYTMGALTERKAAVLESIITFCNDKDKVIATWNIGSVSGVTDTYNYTVDVKFSNGTALFADIDLGIVMNMRNSMEEPFGIIPEPKYDESQKNYATYAYPFYPLLSVPITVKDEKLELTGAVIELMAAKSYTTLTPAFYEKAISSKYIRDVESLETLDIILRSRVYDPLYFYTWKGNTFRNEIQNCLTQNKLTITSTYDKKVKQMNKAFAEVYEAFTER